MLSVPGSDRLPAKERRVFTQEFEKDLKFLQLFYLLVNKSCPIKNLDLVWTEHGPSGRASLRHLGITEALRSSYSNLLGCKCDNPHPAFCNIINDSGRHESESCGVSDKAAEQRVRQTGKAEVYRCDFGLVDIAVPVIVDEDHIATLYTGQVLRQPPSQEGFLQIASDVAHLQHIDLKRLEEAYWSVPVVSEEEIRDTVRLLEAFAEYLANSWRRLAKAVKEQCRRARERQLGAKELAYLALEGGAADRAGLRQLMDVLGLSRLPNRVMVITAAPDEEMDSSGGQFDLKWTSAIQAAEELGDRLHNVVVAPLRRKGICVFAGDHEARDQEAGDLHAYRLAKSFLHAVSERNGIRVRIGVGDAKGDWRLLGDSYREACAALLGSGEAIAKYKKPAASVEELSELSDAFCRAIGNRNLEEAKATMALLASRVSERLADNLQAQRIFLSSALLSVSFAVQKLGAELADIGQLQDEARAELERAANAIDLQAIWLRIAGEFLDEARRLYAGKRARIVERACRMVERQLNAGPHADPFSIRSVAASLGISVGHLSRTFHRATGGTFEHHVMKKRVELAQRLLLDPTTNVAQVSERCGFTDPSYFARVFRKVAGCSPRDYCADPRRLSPIKSN